MKPEKKSLKKEIPLKETHPFSGSMVNFRGSTCKAGYIGVIIHWNPITFNPATSNEWDPKSVVFVQGGPRIPLTINGVF